MEFNNVYRGRALGIAVGITVMVLLMAGSTSASATTATSTDTTVMAWGRNSEGQLGDGTTTWRFTPVQVKLPDGTPFTDVIAIDAGQYYTIALKNDGTVWAWGKNENGQLGDGTTNDRLTPVQVKLPDGTPFTGVTAIAAAFAYRCAEERWDSVGLGA